MPIATRRILRAVFGLLVAAQLTSCAVDHSDAGAGAHALAQAPTWVLDLAGHGTWRDEVEEGEPEASPAYDLIHAWVDARVANLRYHKRVLVEVFAPYENGAVMRTLLPASFRVTLPDGSERWGTDAIEIYPDGGPHGAALAGPVLCRARLQHDLDGDGADEMVATNWRVLFGEGDPQPPASDPWAAVSSPARATDSGEPPAIYFPPFDDAGAATIAEIDQIIAEAGADPGSRHTLHAAVFNINDPGIVDKLIEAHAAGVEVRLVTDGRKFRPRYEWHQGDDRLMAAGVPLLGVKREDSGAMHDKIALFDGAKVATGSFNWEWGSRFENHENMLLSDRPGLVAAYARRFEVLAGGVQTARVHAHDPAAEVSVSFAPDEAPHRIVGEIIDSAQRSIYMAMFTAKDVEFWENGQQTSLLAKLAAARRRGVEVIVIVDYGIHEAAEYHGVETPDDPSDEWLESQDVHVVRADNTMGRYASMHHKLLVVDDAIAITGAYNWYYDSAFRNDEDQLVWRDVAVALRFRAEFVDLLRRYDPAFDAGAWPQSSIQVTAHHDGTVWGEGLRLVGDLDAAGVWDPGQGLELEASDWPRWRASVTLPQGVRMAYKLVRIGRDGSVHWESGPNRLLQAPSGQTSSELEITFRR